MKHKLLEDVVRYDSMNELVKELHCGWNQLFGGYLWQPIKIYEGNSTETRIVTGICSLLSETHGKNQHYYKCMKIVPSKETSVCWECNVYKRFEEQWIKEYESSLKQN